MKVRFSIAKKITLVFGVLSFALLLFIYYTISNYKNNLSATNEIVNIIHPSERNFVELYSLVEKANYLIKYIVFADTESKNTEITQLNKVIDVEYERIVNEIELHSIHWDSTQITRFDKLKNDIFKSLFYEYRILLKKSNPNSEYNAQFQMSAYPLFAESGRLKHLNNNILSEIKQLQINITEKRQINEGLLFTVSEGVIQKVVYRGFSILILMIIMGFLLYSNLTKPLVQMLNNLHQMGKGKLFESKKYNRTDELGELLNALNNVNNGLKATSDFAKEIGKGNYTVDYTPMSTEDQLGNTLLDLRNDLEKATKDAKERKEQDYIQNWTTQGLANFADILRFNNSNINEFGQNIISNIVNYMKINQGGLFIYNDDDIQNPYLDLIAMYAFSRNKFSQKKVLPGEGLVGVSFAEKQTIYMTEVPDSYIEVTSGLGQANPKSILIVPLKIEENVLGIIELASFNEFKPYEIAFIEKVGESIAATLNNVRINNSTAKLLEQSKSQAEAMTAQEEEMRQNLEELQATQEEAARKKIEMEKSLMEAKLEIERLKEELHIKG